VSGEYTRRAAIAISFLHSQADDKVIKRKKNGEEKEKASLATSMGKIQTTLTKKSGIVRRRGRHERLHDGGEGGGGGSRAFSFYSVCFCNYPGALPKKEQKTRKLIYWVIERSSDFFRNVENGQILFFEAQQRRKRENRKRKKEMRRGCIH